MGGYFPGTTGGHCWLAVATTVAVTAGLIAPTGPGTQITQWVTENFNATTIGGQTIYSLSQPKT